MLILKGIIVGLGKIIPGVSGSILAISLGIYYKLIYCINNFFKLTIDDIKFLIKVTIGIIISIVFFSRLILWLLTNYYIFTILFFVGLILGSFGDIKKEANNNYIIIFTLVIVIALSFISIDNEFNSDMFIIKIFYFIFIGFIDAFTTIVPGISGTATLMMLGGYFPLIKSISTILDFSCFMNNLEILIPFSIGFIFGLLITAKIVYFLFNNYKSNTYSAIFGFSISTIIIMIVGCSESFSIKNFAIGILLLFIGVFISKKINQKG